jgi:hypothetical protein
LRCCAYLSDCYAHTIVSMVRILGTHHRDAPARCVHLTDGYAHAIADMLTTMEAAHRECSQTSLCLLLSALSVKLGLRSQSPTEAESQQFTSSAPSPALLPESPMRARNCVKTKVPLLLATRPHNFHPPPTTKTKPKPNQNPTQPNQNHTTPASPRSWHPSWPQS